MEQQYQAKTKLLQEQQESLDSRKQAILQKEQELQQREQTLQANIQNFTSQNNWNESSKIHSQHYSQPPNGNMPNPSSNGPPITNGPSPHQVNGGYPPHQPPGFRASSSMVNIASMHNSPTPSQKGWEPNRPPSRASSYSQIRSIDPSFRSHRPRDDSISFMETPSISENVDVDMMSMTARRHRSRQRSQTQLSSSQTNLNTFSATKGGNFRDTGTPFDGGLNDYVASVTFRSSGTHGPPPDGYGAPPMHSRHNSMTYPPIRGPPQGYMPNGPHQKALNTRRSFHASRPAFKSGSSGSNSSSSNFECSGGR